MHRVMSMKLGKNRVIGSAFLVAGTSIGAGMLALPLTTGSSGFFYTVSLFIGCFLFMLLNLFYLLEASLMVEEEECNLMTMMKSKLGCWGWWIGSGSFLMLLYSAEAAYLSGGGSLIINLLSIQECCMSEGTGIVLFLMIFGFFVMFGTSLIDELNRFCMTGLILSFLLLVFIILPHVNYQHFLGGSFKRLPFSLPVVVLSFTSHILVPSLCSYLHRKVPDLKKALFWGSVIPLIFYLTWEYVVVGMIPLKGEGGLIQINEMSYPLSGLTMAIQRALQFSWIRWVIDSFSFFALVTSFLGVSLSLYDFLSDGFKIKKKGWGQVWLLLFTFIPPLFFALFCPRGFILALGYAGVFVAILFGILPVFLVWQGRYIQRRATAFCVIGGKPLLVVTLLGSIAIIFFQIAMTFHWFY